MQGIWDRRCCQARRRGPSATTVGSRGCGRAPLTLLRVAEGVDGDAVGDGRGVAAELMNRKMNSGNSKLSGNFDEFSMMIFFSTVYFFFEQCYNFFFFE